ncbi:MAG: adenylosuccinate synthase [Lachnospiraceae bacterium]|nr:adenylosuccinate synthase [Lachnospiraceae bacterium]MCR5411406.1 adenylosuccinate synthase [Lachnospiraceae bacterium]
MIKAIVGANWGDEGKGKITDVLAEKADMVARFQGGANAGHTIKNKYGKFALHTCPSGVFNENVTNIIGSGVALDVKKLKAEIDEIVSKGVPEPKLLISDRAQLLMPYHVLFDVCEEERLSGKAYGSTKSGIAPFYSDKYAKKGIQVCDLFDEPYLKDLLEDICTVKNVLLTDLYHKDPLDAGELFETCMEYRDIVKPYVGDVSLYCESELKAGKTLLLEGQLGSMKDPDNGIYPMVTSSSPIAAYGAVSLGVAPHDIKQVITVSKAYSSAVGAGAFTSEIFGDEAEELRRNGGDGGEYGATTGRPRRVGWYDCVASRFGCRVQGTTDVAFTVVDALGYLDEIPVCTDYEIDGKKVHDFPNPRDLERAKPVLTTLPGWKCDITGIRDFDKLPEKCRDYILFIEKQLGYPITMVSNGPSREDIIYR